MLVPPPLPRTSAGHTDPDTWQLCAIRETRETRDSRVSRDDTEPGSDKGRRGRGASGKRSSAGGAPPADKRISLKIKEAIRPKLKELIASPAKPRLDEDTKLKIHQMLMAAEARRWTESHQMHLPPRPLDPDIKAIFRDWFDLVDLDKSGTLEVDELVKALEAAQVPCCRDAIHEMVTCMDYNRCD